ncbi:hypothetical protein JXA56_04805 [Candidatus Micrarchaeota archaeon]|nr:hypothetical protein [Candidatus Micrarchaeota archaeon]
MARKLSLTLYGTAFLISVVIFLSGVFVGSLIDRAALGDLSGNVKDISAKVSSLQILLLMEGNSSAFCPLYLSELQSIDEDMESLGYKLSYLEEEKNAQDPELKKEYFIVQAQSYLLSRKVNEICNDRKVLLINFYSNKDCELCREQGIEILKARNQLDIPLKLYSFDGDLGSPVVDAFKEKYMVRSYPTIIINEKRYPGYHSADEIAELIRGLDDN